MKINRLSVILLSLVAAVMLNLLRGKFWVSEKMRRRLNLLSSSLSGRVFMIHSGAGKGTTIRNCFTRKTIPGILRSPNR